MLKHSLLLLLLIALFSCNSTSKKTKELKRTIAEQERYNEMLDSMRNELDQSIGKSIADTTGIHKAPVQVLKARFVKKEYSNYKDISLSYKNVSDKTIEAIRFRWYAENAFGEPADAGGFTDGIGGGFTDEILRPGKTSYGTWSILSRDGKKVLKAWAYEVVFSDGTKWEFKPSK